MSKDTPAFPFQHRWESGDLMEPAQGLTKRQWYAGQLLAGAWANPECMTWEPYEIANDAFKIADAMIAHEESEK